MLKLIAAVVMLSAAAPSCRKSQRSDRDLTPAPLGQNPSSDSPKPIKLDPTKDKQLIFSAIDPLANPWQASIYALDLADLSISRLLTGESGDPAFFAAAGDLLMFNRSFDSQNYRRLAPNATSFAISPQQTFAAGEVGDPHDLVEIGKNRLLLAHFTQGSLVVVDQSSGQEVQRVEAIWDLPPGVNLKPEALFSVTREQRQFIYVVHQGMAFADGLLKTNGTQRVFVLEVRDGKVEPVDLDARDALVQGIKIIGSFPMAVRFAKQDSLMLVSLCSRFVSDDGQDPAKICKSAVELIDPVSNSSSLLWDLQGSGLSMNGPVTAGPDGREFFANVEDQVEPGKFIKKVIKIAPFSQSRSTVYTFSPNSGGFWGTFYDEASRQLFVGDQSEDSVGMMTVIQDSGEQIKIPLDEVPYSGLFMPKLR